MRIAIAGAGLAGSYAYRLLGMNGHSEVDLFDVRQRIACGITPCGYGVDGKFNELIRRVGLDPLRYVLHIPPRLTANVVKVAARTSIVMIDKPAVIADLLDSAHVHYEIPDPRRYDLLIDATGEARAYSPPLANDTKARVVQWRVRLGTPAATTFLPTRSVPGCAWVMPLSPDGRDAHVGAGCLSRSGVSTRELTRRVFSTVDVASVPCACGSRIRLSGPEFDRVVADRVWAVGEAAGLVSPASGAGNVYAMESALELVSHSATPMGTSTRCDGDSLRSCPKPAPSSRSSEAACRRRSTCITSDRGGPESVWRSPGATCHSSCSRCGSGSPASRARNGRP